MNIHEYIDKLMNEGYSEEAACTAAAYAYTDYNGEDEDYE